MKTIKNVEKFREDLYDAIIDGNSYDFAEARAACTYKDSHKEFVERHSSLTTELPLYDENENGDMVVVSIPYPMRFNGTSLYMTVDEDGVDFWVSTEDYFVRHTSIYVSMYQKKMGFIVAVANEATKLAEKFKKEEK